MSDRAVRAILLDIEGTTTPVEFVYDVLFPFASAQAEQFLRERWDDQSVQSDIAGLRAEREGDADKGLDPPEIRGDPQSLGAYVRWLISLDRKATPLKSLQGKIWRAGYESGQLHGRIYDDVPRALERWRKQGRKAGIFSSGSVLAQRLLFSHTTAGDLTPLLSYYFDTNVGPKVNADSYKGIAAEIDDSPSDILFVSDVVAELDAAQQAGLNTLLCVRPGRKIESGGHESIETFDPIFPDVS
ncbi:MAG: acireductone synthase [Blastocatellia bacterium AA13]|nr:MAG: acireductone synthase [Blastocatellia bacterium AA13]